MAFALLTVRPDSFLGDQTQERIRRQQASDGILVLSAIKRTGRVGKAATGFQHRNGVLQDVPLPCGA
ncbi:hypothetical protein D3C74_232730 [compost metagenome]